MRKRNLFQNLGISFLAVLMAVSSVAVAAETATEMITEASTEIMTENTVLTASTELETEMDADSEAATEVQKAETEICSEEKDQENTEPVTEFISEEDTVASQETEKILPETDSEKLSEKEAEKQSEKISESNSEDMTEHLEEFVPDTESEMKKEECGSEETTEKEKFVETDTEHGMGVLTAKSEIMDMTILAPEDNAFPDGTELVLYAGTELEKVYGKDHEEWKYDEFLNGLKADWKDEIRKEYGGEAENSEDSEYIQYLYPYYFKILDKTGTELKLSEDVQVYVNIYDRNVVEQQENGQYISKIGRHESGYVSVSKDSEVYCNKENGCIAVDTGAEKCGLYTLVQLSDEEKKNCSCGSTEENGFAHAWNCQVFYTALEEVCDCGSQEKSITKHEVSCNGVWEAFHAACTGCVAEAGEKGIIHDNCEVVVLIHKELCECGSEEKNLEKAVEKHDADSDFVRYVMKLADYMNSQIEMLVADEGQLATENISKVSGWSNGSNVTSDYLSVKFYSGKSSLEIIGGSTVSGKWIQGSIAQKYCLYWLPLQDELSDRTSHGARYYNVIYDYKTGKWYDMKFTIQSYRKTSLPKSGKTVYPFAGFYKNQIKFGFDRQGPMVIRCQILEAGTSTEAKIKVKIPVWDIDGAQFVGIKQNNGTMDHRYYYTGADDWLRAKNGVTVAGVSGFAYVEGKFGTSAKDLDTPQACAIWEMTTSDFSFAYGYYNNGTTAESTRWDHFHVFSTNTTIGDGSYGGNGSYGEVSIFSKDNVAPELQNPVKRVSNDNSTWGKSLEISSITGAYYYAIDYTVLDTIPAYKFSSLVLADTLPSGVDYVSGLKVSRLEDGKNKTSWFTTSTENDVVRVEATADALKLNDFYGYTYRITFKVKMDPTEIEPVYQASSGKDIYTVSNKGSVNVKRSNTSSTAATNTVTTTASRKLPVITVYKKNEKEETLSGAKYQITAKNNITSLAGKVLYQAGTVVGTITTGKDGKAVSERLHPGTYTVTEITAPKGYALNTKSQNAKISYLDQETQEGSAELSFVNKRLYSTIKVIKEIDNADIVWAHGNPIFTFKVTGKDVLGNTHTYYDTVEFTKTGVGTGAKATLTAVFKVFAGTYTVSEEQTERYQLAQIHSVVNGTVSGKTAVMNVEGKQTDTTGPVGSAVFYNRKTTDVGQGHTAFVRNSIKK